MAKTEEEKQIAAFENARANKNVNELQSLLTSIMKNAKIDDSRRFAQTVQQDLISGTQRKNLGVKQAPFVVLIGANMPSVLAEVSFLSYNAERQLLSKEAYRLKIAEALDHGIKNYSNNMLMALR